MQTLCAFVMQGCPHCRDVPSLASTVADLAPTHLVDADDDLASHLQIESYPTILLVNPLFTFAYSGPRTPEALRAWVLRMMALTSRFIKAVQT